MPAPMTLPLQPGGLWDTWSRMVTPGMQYSTPSPTDDPFFMRAISSALNPVPTTPPAQGIGYAQGLAGQYGDTPTAASTVGVKSQKAEKIKKLKGTK